MQLSLDQPQDRILIHTYTETTITLRDGRQFQTGVLLGTTQVWPWSGPDTSADLTAQAMAPILTQAPDVFLLGTGQHLVFPATEIRHALAQAGIGLEVMDLSAACRTFNILVSEERSVLALLLVA